MNSLWNKLKSEAVLCIAAVLALVSAFVVTPDAGYAEYIDWRTLAILFSLMSVMAGLRAQGVFDRMGRALISRSGSITMIVMVLMLLCFVSSMIITNDVALITFVPFTFVVLDMLKRRALAVPVVAMQTVAANLGSMLTPIGNPQNLYLYGRSGMGFGSFVVLMLPYAVCSLVLLVIWAVLQCRGKGGKLPKMHWEQSSAADTRIIVMYAVLFVVCLLTVMRVVPYGISLALVLAAVAAFDRRTLRNVDYSLLLTFVAFFVFIGNLGRVESFSGWLGSILQGNEVPVSVLASQVTSNVPAALLLSGFTDNVSGLIVGTNLGGLGTLIASMASLISYRQIAREVPGEKGVYFRLFTVSNLIFLAALMLLWWIL